MEELNWRNLKVEITDNLCENVETAFGEQTFGIYQEEYKMRKEKGGLEFGSGEIEQKKWVQHFKYQKWQEKIALKNWDLLCLLCRFFVFFLNIWL